MNNSAENAAIILQKKAKQIRLVNRLYHKLVSWQFCNKRPQNGRNSFKPDRSFIACSELFSSYQTATEGGIPRSSRSRWFA